MGARVTGHEELRCAILLVSPPAEECMQTVYVRLRAHAIAHRTGAKEACTAIRWRLEATSADYET